MDVFGILEIAIAVLCAVTYGFMIYFKIRGNLLAAVSELIALAEETGMTGSDKMAMVVNELYAMVPGLLRQALNKARIEAIAQTVFDWMRKYTDEYRKKHSEPPG